MKIIVTHVGDMCYAHLEKHPEVHDFGKTVGEAVGNLVYGYTKVFNIQVEERVNIKV